MNQDRTTVVTIASAPSWSGKQLSLAGSVVKVGVTAILGKQTTYGRATPPHHWRQRTDPATLREAINETINKFCVNRVDTPANIGGWGKNCTK